MKSHFRSIAPLAHLATIAMAGCGPAPSDAIASEPAALSSACPALPERVDGGLLVERPVVDGPFDSHLNQGWSKGNELIEIRWLPVLDVGGLHEMLVYTDQTGEQFVIAGFPEDDFDLQLQVGTLVMQVGPYNPTAAFTEDLADDAHRQIIASGKDLSEAWGKMRAVAAIIDRLGVNYDLAGPNSNSATETILKYAGVKPSPVSFVGDVGSEFDVLKSGFGADCDDPNDDVHQVLK